MRNFLILLLLFTLSVSGCSLFDNEDEYIVCPLRTLGIDVTEVGYDGVMFMFNSQTPDPCYKYYWTDIDRDGAEVLVTVYARRKKSLYCACVIVPLSWPVYVSALSSGTYLFRFWKTDSTTVDTTLTVP